MFDWCEGYDKLHPILEEAAELARQHGVVEDARLRVLDVGCGTSSLAKDIWSKGCRVHAVDIDQDVIQAMEAEHAACVGLSWGVVNITAERTDLDENAFDLAVDKGTLDYLLCGEVALVLSALRNVRTALAPCGVLLVVSIHPLPLWQAHVLRWYSGSAKTGSGYPNSWSCVMRMGRVLDTWAVQWMMINSTVLDQHENDYVATCPKCRAQALQRHAKSSS
eukprot:s1627_g15.t1